MATDRLGERQLEILRTVHGDDSPQVAARLTELLRVALAAADWPAVASLGRELLRVASRLHPAGSPETLLATRAVGLSLQRRGDGPGALNHLQQALLLADKLGLAPAEVAELKLELARVLQQEGELARARRTAAEASELLAADAAATGGLPAEIALLQLELAAAAGAGEEALGHLARCRLLLPSGPGPAAPRLRTALEQAARSLARDQPALAAAAATAAVEMARLGLVAEASLPPGEDPRQTLGTALSLLGDLLRRQGELAQARLVLEEALQLARAVGGEESTEVAILLNNLGALCWDLGMQAEGHDLVRQANKLFCEQLGFLHPHTQASGKALMQMLAFLEEEALRARLASGKGHGGGGGAVTGGGATE
ncbi:MAG: tetratricopeptide repeat protein [Myxococcota bacterium]|jgi:hypothetical protein|nr:tetratricopeptide repeat protein [Myxococcota bacterium]